MSDRLTILITVFLHIYTPGLHVHLHFVTEKCFHKTAYFNIIHVRLPYFELTSHKVLSLQQSEIKKKLTF